MLYSPTKYYLAWAAVYFLIIFVIRAKYIVEQNYDNLYRYFRHQAWSKAIFDKTGKKGAPFVFMFVHFFFYLLGHILGILCFHFQYFNYLMAFIWISVAFKNGAGFYMDYFSKKYEDQLKELEQK
jgi:hypothetical protein